MANSYKIPLVRDTISFDDVKKLSDWLLTNPRLTKGELTVQFEEAWSKWNGNRYSVFVNSGSSANLLMPYALMMAKRLKNKKVVVPALSWVTTVAPFIQFGFETILCDCDKDNLGFDAEHFEKLCREHQPSVAIVCHVLGHTSDMERLMEICKKYGVILLEDCCESHGTQYQEKKVGNFGLMSSFSFYFGHHMSTVEGGMIVTDNEELYNILLALRSHGWTRDMQPEYGRQLRAKYGVDDFHDRFTFYYPGFNVRSTDINAFLGLEQLKRLDETVKKREKNYHLYREKLQDHYWVQSSPANLISGFSVGLMSENLPKVTAALEENGIETRPLVAGSMGHQPFWIDLYGKQELPNASKVHEKGFFVPSHQNSTPEEIEKVCEVLISNK